MTARARKPVAGRTSGESGALVSTNGLGLHEGWAAWNDAISTTYCELGLQVERPYEMFDGNIHLRRIGDLGFSWMRSSPHSVVRTPAMISSDDNTDFLFCLVTRGYGEVAQGERSCRLHSGTGTILDSDRPFEFRLPDDFEQVVVRIPRAQLLARLPESVLAASTARTVGDNGIGGLFTCFVQQVPKLDAASLTRSSPVLAGSTLDLLTEAVTAGAAATGTTELVRHADLRRAKAALRATMHDPDQPIEDLCRDLGMSRRHLQSLFHEAGTTPSAWLQIQRVERARQLLRTTKMTAEDIARRCGFRDYSHFHRTFRSQVGQTPGTFRKSASTNLTPRIE
ncbi:AraC family transcriptional regulator [Amycolatopsis benzoatilytica]|uniref:AraC family transcriptional regulator n=1 Tax=Amycolatopsis benzoatilytica TaxID=346045 RepID=UPI00035D4929|nr:AraC family transcriptional regulator [Amycolatopsis benzoatilytica]